MEMIYDPARGDYLCCADKPVFGIESVRPSENFRLMIRFNNGETRLFDARKLMEEPIFEPLKNVQLFMQAHTDGVAVLWNEDLDVAPEYLYENSEPA